MKQSHVYTHTRRANDNEFRERRGPELLLYRSIYCHKCGGRIHNINVRAGDCFIAVSPERRSLRRCVLVSLRRPNRGSHDDHVVYAARH